MTMPAIGFAGLSHLGLVSAAAAAERGFPITAYDGDGELIGRLRHGDLPVVEPGLPELVEKNTARLSFHDDAGTLAACAVVFIAADVATDGEGNSDLAAIGSLIGAVTPHLHPDATLVVLSQVPPGFTRATAAADPRFFCQVETLVFGRAVERALAPERFIVGCADPAASLPEAYARYLQAFGCPVLAMGFESAELAKISINMCLAGSINVANTMAELCEAVGADWGEIAPALRLDRRIGADAYLRAGLGIAGGNLERDLATVIRLAAEHGTDAGTIRAWNANSARRRDWAYQALQLLVIGRMADPAIAVLGLAYKENTHSTRNSPALALLANLYALRVTVYDPVVPATVAGPDATGAASALDAARDADALVIMTPWPEFRDLAPLDLAAVMAGRTIIDPYRVLDGNQVRAAGFQYATLGAPLPAGQTVHA